MQGIDILNFKKYFKRNGDNNTAKIGHVNSLIPIIINDDPISLELKPQFVGQIAIQAKIDKVWIANSDSTWIALTEEV